MYERRLVLLEHVIHFERAADFTGPEFIGAPRPLSVQTNPPSARSSHPSRRPIVDDDSKDDDDDDDAVPSNTGYLAPAVPSGTRKARCSIDNLPTSKQQGNGIH